MVDSSFLLSSSSLLVAESILAILPFRVHWSDLVAAAFSRSRGGLWGMMLRKTTSRGAQKGQIRYQPMTKSRSNSFFSLPGLLVGIAKGKTDSDSTRSPTSPLDYRLFSGFGGHFALSPRSPGPTNAPRKSWDCDRVGLGLIDSLGDGGESCRRVLLGSSENRNILLGSQSRINIPSPKTRLDHLLAGGSATSPKSLPKNYVISTESPHLGAGSSETGTGLLVARPEFGEPGKIQPSRSSSVGTSPSPGCEVLHSESKNARAISPLVRETKFETSFDSLPDARGFMASLSASEIEQSEDYTCIISRGPNPKTTRIFGDRVLETYAGDMPDFSGDHQQGEEARGCSWMVKCPENPLPFPAEDFLRVCFSCKKKLEGKDIYIYRGEKAFCSCSCRSREIMFDEEMEEPPAIDSSCSTSSTRASCCEEIFPPGVAVAT